MIQPVTKVVIPAAGLGTRFLPATKTLPKELLPVVTKPTLQYGVEEAYAAGIRQFVFVISPDKPNPAEHFLPNSKYQKFLEEKGKEKLLEDLNKIIDDIEVVCVEQKKPLGLGHAVYVAHEVVGNDPFVVLLPDMIYDAKKPPTRQLIEAFQKVGCSINLTEHTPKEKLHLYGVYGIKKTEGRLHYVNQVIEKPKAENAPSDLVVGGRYLFTSEAFTILKNQKPGRNGEIQLADTMHVLAQQGKFCAYEFEGLQFDTGDPVGFLKANIHFGIKKFGKEKVWPA